VKVAKVVVPIDLVESDDPDGLTNVPAEIFGAHMDKLCDYTCRKCDFVPLNAACLRCGCPFCSTCFDKIRSMDKCSACASDIVRDDDKKIITAPAYLISGKLKTLEVTCLHRNIGCPDKMLFGDNGKVLLDHLRECKFALVKCPDCESVMSKGALAIHKPDDEMCQDSMHTCVLCRTDHRLKDMGVHKMSAEHIQIACEYTEIHTKIITGMLSGQNNVDKKYLEERAADPTQVCDSDDNLDGMIIDLKDKNESLQITVNEQGQLIEGLTAKLEAQQKVIEEIQKKIGLVE